VTDDRTRLAQALWDATRAQNPEDFMPTVMTDMGSCLHVADILIADGWINWKVEQGYVEIAGVEYNEADLDAGNFIARRPQPSERCGEPHPHYSSMSCGREPGHDDAHSYGVQRGPIE